MTCCACLPSYSARINSCTWNHPDCCPLHLTLWAVPPLWMWGGSWCRLSASGQASGFPVGLGVYYTLGSLGAGLFVALAVSNFRVTACLRCRVHVGCLFFLLFAACVFWSLAVTIILACVLLAILDINNCLLLGSVVDARWGSNLVLWYFVVVINHLIRLVAIKIKERFRVPY